MELQAEWDRFLLGELVDGSRLFEDASQQIEDLLHADPRAAEAVGSLIIKHLSQDFTPQTWTDFSSALDVFWGRELTNLVMWLAKDENPFDRLDLIKESMSSTAFVFLRKLMGLYKDELLSAVAASAAPIDDWRLITRETNIDQVTGRLKLKLTILKVDRKWVVLECTPDGMLNLGAQVVALLQSANPETFNDDAVSHFLSQSMPLIQQLSARGEAVTPLADHQTASDRLAP